jgi:hypothetical protein
MPINRSDKVITTGPHDLLFWATNPREGEFLQPFAWGRRSL